MTGGTNNTNGELWVGQGAGAVGVATVNAGTVTVNNWIAVGREGSTGTLNVGGTGVVNKIGGGHITLGTGTATGPGGTGIVNGNLTTGNSAATLDVGTGKTFDVNGALNVALGNTFDLTGRAIPAAAGTGSFGLGTVDSIVGTFGPGLTNLTGLSNPSGATFIS